MFGIFVHYSTRPIYDVSMNLFCRPPSVDIFNILPGFLWQPLLNTWFHEAILPHWRYTFYPFLLVYSWPTLILLGSLGPVISYIFFTVHIKEGCRSRNQRNQSRCCMSLISILALLCVWIPVKSLAVKRYDKSNVTWYFWGKTSDKRCYY